MRVGPLPKSWLIHDMIYTEKPEEDNWGNPIGPDPVTINHVRYDDSTVFSRDSMQSKIVAEGVIFVDATHSKPIIDFKEESTVKINGKTLTIKKVVPCYYPNKNKIHHWELEVI